MKFVNKSLVNLLRCCGDHVRHRIKRCQAEFAHNLYESSTVPFQVVYSAQPRGPLDLMTPCVSSFVPKKVQDFVAGLHDVHKVGHENLDHCPVGEYNKLSAKKIGPLKIMEKINSNAFRLKLPSHIGCSDVFNDLAMNSRMNFVYPGGNDGGRPVTTQIEGKNFCLRLLQHSSKDKVVKEHGLLLYMKGLLAS
ncbi:hypothetical protein Tco_0458069 [Tanacetum coccineum]